MTTARSTHAAATYFSGDSRGTLVAIGGTFDRPLDTYEVFDPETSRWTSGQLPATADVRVDAVSGPDGKVYYVYGRQHETWVYDGAWNRSLAPPPSSCLGSGLALGSDRLLYVLCAGGSATPGSTTPNPLMTYDTALDKWASLNLPPRAPVNIPWMTSLGSRIYVVSTSDGNNYPLEAYDIGTSTWSTLAAPAVPSHIIGAPDGRVYSIAGFDVRGPIMHPTPEVQAYNPATNRWTNVAPLNFNRYDHAVTVGPDGRLYAMGGVYNGTENTDSVEVYGPAASLSSSNAAAGDTITLTGNNFAAGATVSVYLGPATGAALAVGMSNGVGALDTSIAVRVPAVAPGNYVVTVVDDRSRYPVRLPLRVN
jgi:hypothetical protein